MPDQTSEELRVGRAAELRVEGADRAESLATQGAERAAALAAQTVERATELARTERERAIALAENRGRESAVVDARLADHDRHFQQINGSIERLATAQEAMASHALRATAAQDERDKLADRERQQLAQGFTRRQFWIGASSLAAMAGSAVFTATGHL